MRDLVHGFIREVTLAHPRFRKDCKVLEVGS